MVEDGVCTTEDELNSSGSELDEAEQRRELLTDVSYLHLIFSTSAFFLVLVQKLHNYLNFN